MSVGASGAELLLALYREGLFPMAEHRDDRTIQVIDPDFRGVIPLDSPHIPRRLARTIRADPFTIRIDAAFRETVRACAAPGPGREDTWISHDIEALYAELHRLGAAHSVECWSGSRLIGGLYGVSLGGAFFGESMFSRATDASKVALVHLIARLKVGGYVLLDTQFLTEHLARFGAVEIPRADYRRRLALALEKTGDFFRLPPYAAGAELLQAISQRS